MSLKEILEDNGNKLHNLAFFLGVTAVFIVLATISLKSGVIKDIPSGVTFFILAISGPNMLKTYVDYKKDSKDSISLDKEGKES